MGTAADIYGGRDPRELPRYTVTEAAHYLRLPSSTLKQWVHGRSFRGTHGQRMHAKAVIELPAENLLTFLNLVEAFVLASIRRQHQVPLQKVRKALDFVRDEMGVDRPLVEQDFETNGADLFVQRLGKLINVSSEGQAEMRAMLELSLARVDRNASGLLAVFPWARRRDEPKAVEIDPRRAYGKLVIAGTGIPTAVVADRMSAGESIDDLAEDFGLPRQKIEAALRWELPERHAAA
jgi:uncharacterized protein (DUF433 family)